MKGWKGFDKDFKCRGKQYTPYTLKGGELTEVTAE